MYRLAKPPNTHTKCIQLKQSALLTKTIKKEILLIIINFNGGARMFAATLKCMSCFCVFVCVCARQVSVFVCVMIVRKFTIYKIVCPTTMIICETTCFWEVPKFIRELRHSSAIFQFYIFASFIHIFIFFIHILESVFA